MAVDVRELDQTRPHRVVEAVGRCPAAVAVREAGPTLDRSGQQAPHLAGREGEDRGGLVDRQAAGEDMLEHERPMLGPSVGRRWFVVAFHAPDGDKVAGRLARTESLADDTTSEIGLTGVDRGDTIQLSDV